MKRMTLEHQPHPGPSIPQWWARSVNHGVYKRYSFVLSSIKNCWFISRDGHHISSENTLAGVKATIDMLTEDDTN